MNNLGRLIIAFAAVILIIIFPLPYAAQTQNEVMDGHVESYTKELSDAIRQKGYLDQSTYESFVNRLDRTGDRYEIDIEDIHPVIGEEISSAKDSTGFLVASTDSLVQTDSETKTSYMSLNNQRSAFTFLSNSKLLFNLKSKSLLENSKNLNEGKTFSLSTHTHTDDCYIDDFSVKFDYTGGPQYFTVPKSGFYKLEAWGAQGGETEGYKGGLGGYAAGDVYLTEGQTLAIDNGECPNYAGITGIYGMEYVPHNAAYCGCIIFPFGDSSSHYRIAGGGGLSFISNFSKDVIISGDLTQPSEVSGWRYGTGSMFGYNPSGVLVNYNSHVGSPDFSLQLKSNYYIEIVIKNTGDNPEIRLGLSINAAGAGIGLGCSVPISTNDTDYITYRFYPGSISNSAPYWRDGATLREIGITSLNNGLYIKSMSVCYDNYDNKYLIAGSGGGAISYKLSGFSQGYNTYPTIYGGINGGNGGGFNGENGNITPGSPATPATGGTQFSAGASGYYQTGDGQNGALYGSGAGYFPGGPGGSLGYLYNAETRTYVTSGAGGSSYIGGVSNGKTEAGVCYGNGYARISRKSIFCDRVVTSITATNPVQTVKQGEAIISTAIATMLDGSTKTVNCSVSGYDGNQIGTQTATLTYSGLVGNAKTHGTRTCSVNVTVLNPKLLSYITVSPSQQTISRNGIPSFMVTAYYSDGTSADLSSSQYTRNSFDSSIGGPHTINFSYTENSITKTATATVNVDELLAIYATPTNPVVERYTRNLPITVIADYRYSGKRNITGSYVLEGYLSSKIGIQDVTLSYSDNGITKSVKLKVTVTVLHRTCPRCGTTYDFNPDDSDPGCPNCRKTITSIQVTPEELEVTQGQNLPVTVRVTYADGSSEEVYGWASNFDPNKIGIQQVTIQYGGYAAEITVWVNEKMITCPVCGKEYPASYSNCPYCAKKLVRISVAPNDITVRQYEILNLNVTAYYADGSSEVVTEWSIDTTTTRPGSYEATVRYKSVSAKIKVKVLSETAVICPICGTSYEPMDHPRGCPVCSSKLTGIEAYLTNGSNKVQLGTMPDITVVLVYLDTHREIVTEGYSIENYAAEKMGKQKITIRYDKFTYLMEIEVVNTLASIICPNGHIYYRNEDGSDPGCPYCNKKDSKETVLYYDITYLEEILDTIYNRNTYYFQSGNYITIKVVKKDKSLLTKVQNMFLRTTVLGRKKEFTYGGEVL